MGGEKRVKYASEDKIERLNKTDVISTNEGSLEEENTQNEPSKAVQTCYHDATIRVEG